MTSLKNKLLILLFIFPISVFAKTEVTLNKCVDGDTFKANLNKEVVTVRLLAVDTPEVNHPKKHREFFGKEASNLTCNLLKNNKIYLEYDTNSEKIDKYDRTLAWVYVGDILLQEVLVEKGLAKVAYLYGDYKYTDQLLKKESEAKKENLGIWTNENSFILLLIEFINDIIETIIDVVIDFVLGLLDQIFKGVSWKY